jgi:hypothetical protein
MPNTAAAKKNQRREPFAAASSTVSRKTMYTTTDMFGWIGQ